ncbi:MULTISPECIES: adenosylcobinamide-GDP ribazoletransferase [Acinetobacter]|uniref:Adenosylcobinamide-GDP ribazoletransferase n=1 Tax=Acinetobacter chengduensis TaxID=2420890 RepID=A0ABX9TZ61_9GAMM|nr:MULTISPECIES: adenosylcobinamide-GDP ribazoletransferase [Acinetobacter]MBI1452430.1 adenosylcobinamide-GDP ribazoletransferase [Acinetobacter sp. FL51]RKG44682.1 adenosylcobinamide-GDP ribazoletransferase [Acinetobacter sp. WCHAc060007]RLL23445.1 adenosylcobinamide-GDP ribazoletransferase [Acinetobacter chengduensis]
MMPFWIALQFLTTFPVQLKAMPSKQQNGQSVLFYPLVGLIIGAILCGIAMLLQAVPAILSASIILVLWIWLTGGLHLDGLADTADAWVGGFGDAERTLKIMKDPACGPIGVLSLIIICLLKWSALYLLIQKQLYSALVLFPVLGRLAPMFLFLTTDYVREKGLGSSMASYIPKKIALAIMLFVVISSLYSSVLGCIASLATILGLLYLRRKFKQRIGGITGDTVGASIEICECVSLLAFVLGSYFILA